MNRMGITKTAFAILAAISVVCGTAMTTSAASFAEPSTVFYGKVLALNSSGPPELLTRGELTWTIRLQDDSELTLRTTLYALNRGEFSYRLDIPHRALALGLVLDEVINAVPISALVKTHQHFDIEVDGQKAHMIGPAGSQFDLSQARRAATYRMDLAITRESIDTDGDGMADWWEERNGLDKQDPDDAAQDTDNDGVNNLDEFLQGLDPNTDSRLPKLQTRELMIYADGVTGVLLETADIDSTPAQLVYTLTRAPSRGQLLLRNTQLDVDAPDGALGVGGGFTQEDVQNGRLIFLYDGADEHPISIEVSVVDENPEHAAAEGRVFLFPYRPNADLASRADDEPQPAELAGSTRIVDEMEAGEDRRIKNYLLSRTAAFQVRDGSQQHTPQIMSSPSAGLSVADYTDDYMLKYGADRRQILVGGHGVDQLTGSMVSDIILGGAKDDVLRGNGGADWFVWQQHDPGNDTIEDFSTSDGDIIDLSEVISSSGGFLDDYLLLERVEGSAPQLRIDANGDGSGFDDFAIALPGLDTGIDLDYLAEHGHLIVDGLGVKPRVNVLVHDGTSGENGPDAGAFILSRTGSLDADLTVNISMNGSAQNGVDYSSISGPLVIPAGQSSLIVTVTPFVDSETEADETVELIVLSSTNYFGGFVDRASLSIEDLRLIVEIEALEPLAIRSTLTPGSFLVTRSAILNRSVLVRLTIGGTATSGIDYEPIVGYVNLVPFQTSAIVQVVPLVGANLDRGRESVVATIEADAGYRIGPQSAARVMLIEQTQTLADWRDQHFPGHEGTLDEFAAEDSGNRGVPHLLRYAYGMDVNNPDLARMPRFYLKNRRLTVDLFRNPAATDVEYRVAVSGDLDQWNDTNTGVEELLVLDDQAEPGSSCFQAQETMDTAERLFMLIEVRRTP
jgi:hypothetical protein